MGRPKKSETTVKDKRTGDNARVKVWTFIVYPESVKENWREILDEMHIQWVESPLHDKDLNATGEAKKAHRHVMVIFNSVKTYEQVLDVTEAISATIPERVRDSRAMVRYFAHRDNPEKYQYDISDIVGHGGVDVSAMLAPSASERRQVLREMLNFIRDNDITCYSDFVDYCLVENGVWFEAISEHATYVVKEYIKSRSWKKYQRPLLEAASKQSD